MNTLNFKCEQSDTCSNSNRYFKDNRLNAYRFQLQVEYNLKSERFDLNIIDCPKSAIQYITN